MLKFLIFWFLGRPHIPASLTILTKQAKDCPQSGGGVSVNHMTSAQF